MADMKKHLLKANNELSALKAKFENGEGGIASAEVEELKRKHHNRLHELESQLEESQSKCSSLEKTRTRLQGELEDLTVEAERVMMVFCCCCFLLVLLCCWCGCCCWCFYCWCWCFFVGFC